MPVLGLDHVNIRTADLQSTLGFFRDILGMTVTPVPGQPDMAIGGWVMDAQGSPVVHVGHADTPYPGDNIRSGSSAKGSGAIHHVALNGSGYEATCARFEALDLSFAVNVLPAIGLRQIFVNEPNGILIELNFRDE